MRLYEGLRVVEFTTNIAGPTIGRWLAEYGADVIHVERPVYGDDSRGYPPMFDGVSAQYHTLNHGKKSLVLDLKDKAAGKKDNQDYRQKCGENGQVYSERHNQDRRERRENRTGDL